MSNLEVSRRHKSNAKTNENKVASLTFMNTRKNIIVTSTIALVLAWGMIQGLAQTLTLSPGVDYTKPNYAYSGPIAKFTNSLPGLGGPGNEIGQYIPVAVANAPYSNPWGTTNDYYEIALVEYIERMHIDLPVGGTKLRGYVQIVPSGYSGAVALTTANGCSMNVTNGAGAQMYGATKPHYLGPLILSTMNRAVRIKFMNLLPTGVQGRLFVPVDTNSIMGAGDGWKTNGTDANGLPTYYKYTQNRATIHLHGGLPPWISDGTPHQWTVPAGEVTPYKKGASAAMVPDMEGGTNQDGVITFYWPNQMSGRLLFYHDHAWGATGADVYSGQAAGLLLVDPVEESALAAAGVPGTIVTDTNTGSYTPTPVGNPDMAHLIPLIIQDKTFVPSPAKVLAQDPNWTSDIRDGMTGFAPTEGNLWYPHVYIPNQWPENPDQSGSNPLGRWDWGPWFWPLWPVAPGVVPPTVSHTPEAFMDTMMVNGQPYPYQNVDPTKYRLRILNACNDRFVNLQLYKATPGIITNIAVKVGGTGYDPLSPPLVTITGGGGRGAIATATVSDAGIVTDISVDIVGSGYATLPTVAIEAPPGGGTQATADAEIYTRATEVGMVPASPTAGISFPAPWRAQTIPYTPDILDGRVGGIPDPTNRGPAMVQIGTEGGLLPAPVVLPNTPVGYEENKKNIVVLNVKQKTLFLAPAERADVVVDFTPFAGRTVILYNDSGAPVPAADGRNDLYTGNPDYTENGGAPSTKAGMGPSTRTIMAFRVNGTPTTTVPDYVTPGLVAALATPLKTLFVSEQPAPIVPEAAYTNMYTGGAITNLYSRIQDTSLSFVPYGTTHRVTMQMQPKTIQELFDDVGRLNATLGTELPFTTWAIQTTVPLNYVDPATEVFNDGETQIWKITHNGVDSHGVHFHLFDVQVINRVGWDGQITPPDANERGWKETVRMNPLEDIIVAMRAVKPNLTKPGWSVDKSWRLLNPAVPTNSLVGFSNLDPLTGNAFAPAMSNVWTDFGWEYAWHCHILGHEDNDMMRPVVMNVQESLPAAPTNLTATLQTTPTLQVNLAWTDNSINEVGFQIQRRMDGTTWTTNGLAGANSRTFSDPTIVVGHLYEYQVCAYNSKGDSAFSNIASVSTVTGQPIPASLTATPSVLSTLAPTVAIRFVDNSTTETGFTLQRATDVLFTVNLTSFPLSANTIAVPATVGYVNYTDTGVAEATTYYYRVRANGTPANSAWSNIATATTPGRLPIAPSTFRFASSLRTTISLSWADNSSNETGFHIWMSSTANGTFSLVATVGANIRSGTVGGLTTLTTYYFRVTAFNAYGDSTPAPATGSLAGTTR